MRKRFLSVAVAAVLAAMLLPVYAEGVLDPPVEGSVPISNKYELAAIAGNLGGKYHLTADIDLSGDSWMPLGNSNTNVFTGVFDGRGHVIRNMMIMGNRQYSGLFGYASDSAVIKNVGMEGTNINITPSYPNAYAGGISGRGGMISNCYNTGRVYVTVRMDILEPTSVYAGGICGYNGNVRNSYNKSDVSAYIMTLDTYAPASGTSLQAGRATAYAGGIGGYNGNGYSIDSSYNTGDVEAFSSRKENDSVLDTDIANPNPDHYSYAGGICGVGQAASSYWSLSSAQKINNQPAPHKKGVGDGSDRTSSLTYGQMRQQDSFSGWDFTSVWGFVSGDNEDFPVLRAFYTDAPNLSAAGSWARVHINGAYKKGFLPFELQSDYKQPVTRKEFVTLAMSWLRYHTGLTDAQLVERYAVEPDRTFSDTNDPVILAAGKLDITAGIGNGQFGPGTVFTRQQAAMMLLKVHNILNKAGGTFNTINPPAFGWADITTADTGLRGAVDFVGTYGIMSGDGKNFDPRGTFSREHSITVFNKMG